MKKLGAVLILLCVLFSLPSGADSIRMAIGVDLFEYPELEVIPGYPVYYAPRLRMNYFFYEGKYWVYQDDNWYESSWYDGPWWQVSPEDVPDYILRVPLQYYVERPTFFIGWIDVDPPHWGEHWGHDWERRRHGWDKWDHRIHLKPAPLPHYQKEYSGNKYPWQIEQQHELHQKNYNYQPHDPYVQLRRHEPIQQGTPVRPGERLQERREAKPQEMQHSVSPQQQGNPATVRVTPQHRNAVTEQLPREQKVQEHRDQEKRPPEPGTQETRRWKERDRGRER